MIYRPEIDGLRAIAILSVLFYHAGFSWLPGGFLGVDIFFVISGYLITKIILSELEGGTFSYRQFYIRRAKRILPVLLFVLFITLLAAYFILLPTEYLDMSNSALSVLLFISNIFFWMESGYFDGASQFKPLLHTWSLSVEEQYYILFPVLLSLLVPRRKSSILPVIIILIILSFCFSVLVRTVDEMANFYLLPSRAWQLLVGSLCAIVPQNISNKNGKLALSGVVTIMFSVFVADSSMNLPGYFTILPTLGTAIVIAFATSQTLTAQILGHRLLVSIGLVSYSAYLWHQPIFAFSRIHFEDELPAIVSYALLIFTALISYVSWRFIETPFRKTENFWGRKNTFLIALLLANILVLGVIYIIQTTNGFQKRFAIPASVYESLERSEKTEKCFDIKDSERARKWNCVLGDQSGSEAAVVFGDSHALAMLPAFDEAAKITGTKVYFVGSSGCIPFLDIHALRRDQHVRNCHDLNKTVLDLVEEKKIPSIFLIARWSYYTDGGYEGDNLSIISKDPTGPKNKTSSRNAFTYGLSRTITEYALRGISPVFIQQIPEQIENPLNLYAASVKRNVSIEASSVPKVKHRALQAYVKQQFSSQGASILDFSDIMCGETFCSVGNSKQSYYFDSNHLSVTGAQQLIPAVVHALQGTDN